MLPKGEFLFHLLITFSQFISSIFHFSDDSESTEASMSDLEQRLRPIQTKRMLAVSMTKDTANGISDTTLVIRERKSDNSPR